MAKYNSKNSALILIDLQNNILSLKTEPESSLYILKECKGLARKFREEKSNVIVVNVDFGKNLEKYPKGDTEVKVSLDHFKNSSNEVAEGIIKEGDKCITKNQWGAFVNTDLENYLKEKGIVTVFLAGISTNFGVESTARQAWELGFNVVIVEDCCSSTIGKEAHDFSINKIFPKIAKITRSANIKFS